MRILLGCLDLIDKNYYKEALSDFDFKIFSVNNADIVYNPQIDTFETILSKLPSNWEPDVVLFFHPEYQNLPINLENTEYPLVALISDWNLGFNAIMNVIDCFDYIFTDKRGEALFKSLGYYNVEYKPIYAYSPTWHYRYKNIEKIYDISLIGNLNPGVQKERSLWLKRLSKLSTKYRIAFLTKIYGHEYTRVINQSKITFNRSIRKEMNMRVYEAAACGSLLFYEEDNEEIHNVFKDKVHCVLYNENNLEELLDYYLNNDKEREIIINNAYEQIKKYTYKYQLTNIINRLQEIGLDKFKTKKKFSYKSDIEKFNSLAKHNYLVRIVHPLIDKCAKLQELINQGINNDEIFNNLGVINIRLYDTFKKSSNTQANLENYTQFLYNEAIKNLNYAISLNSNYALTYFNLGQIYLKSNQIEEALNNLKKAIYILENENNIEASIKGLYYPHNYDLFRYEWEQILIKHYNNKEQLLKNLKNLLLAKSYECLGEYYLHKKEYQQALIFLTNSLNFYELNHNYYKLGLIYSILGDKDNAIKNLELSISKYPFLIDAYIVLLNILANNNDIINFKKLLIELLSLLNTDVQYNNLISSIFNLLNLPILPSELKEELNKIYKYEFFNLYSPNTFPLSIESDKNFHFIYIWDNNTFKQVINSYILSFKKYSDVCLILLVDSFKYNEKEVQNSILMYIQETLNLSVDEIPDILIFSKTLLDLETPSLLKTAKVLIHTPRLLDIWYLAALNLKLPVIGSIQIFDNNYEPVRSIYSLPNNFTETELSNAMLNLYNNIDKYSSYTNETKEIINNRYKNLINNFIVDYYYRTIYKTYLF